MKWWQFGKRDADLKRELQSDLQLEEEEQREQGVAPEEARYAALRAFGNPGLIRERTREAWSWYRLATLLRDLRISIRTLSRSPGFCFVAVITLALGIGANTAMFSLLDQIVLRLLPVKEPERLVMVTERGNFYGDSYGPNTLSWPMFEDLRDNSPECSAVFLSQSLSVMAITHRK